jgi:hypothetical protein
MSTVGLTKAQERALRNYGDASDRMLAALVRDGFLVDAPMNCYDLTPRGHAALAAPRMTDEQYTTLALIEGHGEAVVTHPRIYATFVRNGWVSYRRITPAGRTALNNVRAAMGSPDWKEGL